MNKHFRLTCDESNSAVGFVLGQIDNQNKENEIAYGGKSLPISQIFWTTTEKECQAVVESVKVYLSIQTFTIFTDQLADLPAIAKVQQS